jgi:hypothetical protein
MGIEYDDVNSSFKDILKDANSNRGKLFGIDYKELQETNTGFIESGMSNIGNAAVESAKRAKEGGFTDMFDTAKLREGMSGVIKSIVDTMPKPEAVKQAAKAVSQTTATGPVVSPQATRLDPIVTSLGKVGGGGYSSGTLDAQRENNRLTGETNRLLKDMNRSIGNLGGSGQAAFG